MRVYIVWMNGIRVTLKIPTISAFHVSSRELAKLRDKSRNTLTLQLPACAPHVTFAGCTAHEQSHKINFLSNVHQLNTKPNTNKSHKIQENKLMKLQHFLSWDKVNINVM